MSQEVNDALNAAGSMDDTARRSQANIDRVVDETREIERRYRAITKEVDGLEVYNALLQKQIDSQGQEIADLNRSIDQVSVIERQVTPLMMRMVESLEQFVELDVPFLLEERRKRVSFLAALLERSDVTVAEKFRRVLEAYKGSLEVAGGSREVDFLRIGRTALLYQTVDGEIFGMWDKAAREWVPLPAEYRNQIKNGIKIARKQVAPDLLLLPVAAPEEAP
jgi:hypothetical protein